MPNPLDRNDESAGTSRPHGLQWYLRSKVVLAVSIVLCLLLAEFLFQTYRSPHDVETSLDEEPFDLAELQINHMSAGDVTQKFQQLWARFKAPTDDEIQLILNVDHQGFTSKYESLRPWLNDNEPILAELRELASLGKSTFLNADLIHTETTKRFMTAFQGFQFLLRLKAQACLADGDIDASWEWMKVTLQIGRLISRHQRGTTSVFGHDADRQFHATVFANLRRWTADDRTTVEHLKTALDGLKEDERPPLLKSGVKHAISERETELNEQIAGERAAQLMVACQIFHRLHGRFPSALSDLVPEILSELPSDPFGKDGRTLHYEVRDAHAVIYSLGTDRVDNGGDVYSKIHSDIGERFSAKSPQKQ